MLDTEGQPRDELQRNLAKGVGRCLHDEAAARRCFDGSAIPGCNNDANRVTRNDAVARRGFT